ncbi:Vacuolar protein sorting-associated protein 55 [Candida viswanathii]|uniref:Vacuolar protein sorting-associated protein 55 n=1 Tax=Candida viswanathii TaxID=5486 RepID=A0A367YJC4_9ASCO|nr:Vacuolar protein sorting-associated protein 55 [Candida viswanathii]
MNSTNPFSSLKKNPLNKIIGLSVVLAVGFLLVILAGIYGNWFPIIIGLIFAVAHLPVAITRNISSSSDYDFNFDSTTANANVLVEVGQFVTAFLLVTGVYLPILLNHSLILTKTAMVLSIVGGLLIYGTVYLFSHYFDEPNEEDELADLGGGVI